MPGIQDQRQAESREQAHEAGERDVQRFARADRRLGLLQAGGIENRNVGAGYDLLGFGDERFSEGVGDRYRLLRLVSRIRQQDDQGSRIGADLDLFQHLNDRVRGGYLLFDLGGDIAALDRILVGFGQHLAGQELVVGTRLRIRGDIGNQTHVGPVGWSYHFVQKHSQSDASRQDDQKCENMPSDGVPHGYHIHSRSPHSINACKLRLSVNSTDSAGMTGAGFSAPANTRSPSSSIFKLIIPYCSAKWR